jgi:beta-lactamase regulating signal transducer with metallopeptidase domain
MSAIADHLWQSTWFACAAWLLALFVRKDSARVRYWVWMAASLKFLVPFAVLSWIGNHFVIQLDDMPTLLPFVQQAAAPLTGTITIEYLDQTSRYAVIAVWVLGSVILLGRWIAGWLRSRSLVRTSTVCEIVAPIAVRCSDRLAEPAVVGILDPVVLLPRYALRTLTPAQIHAVIAHEAWHVRRRDNLAASLHNLVQIVFWFHPLLWWIGAKLIHEREHACDEGAIQDGYDPLVYAETLLRVCRHAVTLRHLCAASVSGGDLRARVHAIVSGPRPSRVALLNRAVLAAALFACISLATASGMRVFTASDLTVAAGARSIQLNRSDERSVTVVHDDYIYARNTSLRELISEAYAVNGRGIRSDDRALDYPRYNIELRTPRSGSGDRRQLVADFLKQQFNLELITR